MSTIPEDFAEVIAMARNAYGEDFFVCGGCGVFASLLAEVAQAKGQMGSLYLIIQVSDGDSLLSHICFSDPISNDMYDITGGQGADQRWERFIQEESLGWEDPAFEYEEVLIDHDSDILAILKNLTSEYFLNVSEDWVDSHYLSLRNQALSVAGLTGEEAAA